MIRHCAVVGHVTAMVFVTACSQPSKTAANSPTTPPAVEPTAIPGEVTPAAASAPQQPSVDKTKFVPQMKDSPAAARVDTLLKQAGALAVGGNDCGQWQPSPEVQCSLQCGQGDLAGQGDPAWLSLASGRSDKAWSPNHYCIGNGNTNASATCQSTLQGTAHFITATMGGNAQRFGSCSGCAGSLAHLRPTWTTTIDLGAGLHEVLVRVISARLTADVSCSIKIGDPANPGGSWEITTNKKSIDQTLDATAVSGKTPITVSCPNLVQAGAYGCPENYNNPVADGSLSLIVIAGP